MERPLAGVRILELATGIAGPYAGKLLADYGAEVIKAEPVEGDESRGRAPFLDSAPDGEWSALFLHLNANKRAVTVAAGTPGGQDLIRRLVSSADICLESFAPGALAGWGLGFEALREINPSLVLTSVTPFGQDGPYAGYRGSELVYAALGGMNATRGADRRPVAPGGNLSQYHAGCLAAAATMGALLAAEENGEGEHVDISIMAAEAASADSTMVFLTAHAYNGRTSSPPPASAGPQVTGLGPLPNGAFACADGTVTVSTVHQWVPRMLKVVDDPVLAEIFSDPARLAEPGTAAVVDDIVARWFRGRTKREAMLQAQALGWPVTAIQAPAELLDDPHFSSRGAVFQAEHPEAGRIAQLGPPIRLAGGWQLRRPAPRLGEHNDEVYGELGLGRTELAAYRAAGVI
ncbi:CoA transferase [Acrocarpospora macrocephala]|uniref:CoA transferase n=1 Tax=Acrocarpospora macrocephala TaxID=150177 RepID=A0A5M3WJI9_9ACTN|nr:CoA transferase [Acrocarpospora macrocephala]GES09375.1 CoA transferase [Acrocarpospora macrocephala]